MKLLDRAAHEIGVAIGDCGGMESSGLVDELARLLAELASSPKRSGWRNLVRYRRRRAENAARAESRPASTPSSN